VELEAIVPTKNGIIPYFWVRNAEPAEEEDIELAFEDLPSVESVELVDDLDREYLLRIVWSPSYNGILRGITETDVTLLSAVGTVENWRFEIRSVDQDALTAFRQYCLDHDVPLALETVQSEATGSLPSRDLTGPQREALLLAYERGYFDTPRRVTLDDIAGDLGITRQALSARLRRGHRRLIEGTLADDGDPR
jgi:predicted DNA binding protein